jgi:hypothetical protein
MTANNATLRRNSTTDFTLPQDTAAMAASLRAAPANSHAAITAPTTTPAAAPANGGLSIDLNGSGTGSSGTLAGGQASVAHRMRDQTESTTRTPAQLAELLCPLHCPVCTSLLARPTTAVGCAVNGGEAAVVTFEQRKRLRVLRAQKAGEGEVWQARHAHVVSTPT